MIDLFHHHEQIQSKLQYIKDKPDNFSDEILANRSDKYKFIIQLLFTKQYTL